MAEHDGKSRTGRSNLGYAVLPIVLARTAHHEQIALSEVPRPGPPATDRTYPELSWFAGADDGHGRILEMKTFTIGVPGNRIPAVAIQVEPDRVERPGVVARQRSTCVGKDG